MIADFNPRSMDWIASKLGVSVNGTVATCRVVFPSVEIGTYQQPRDLIIPLFVYATITRLEGVEWRGGYIRRDTDGIARVHVAANGKREWL